MEETLNKILQELSEMKSQMVSTDQKIEQMNDFMHVELGNVRNEMSGMETGLKAGIGNVHAELKEDIGNVRMELKADMGNVYTELKEDIQNVHTELKEDLGNVRMELKEDIGSVRTELIEGQARLEKKLMSIPENYENLEVYIGRQQRTMEKLSERSIRHEADIQFLKSARS
ncbi:hypothetical protein [Salibacterium sp. K-3]